METAFTETDLKAFKVAFAAVGADVLPTIDAESGHVVIERAGIEIWIDESSPPAYVISKQVIHYGTRYYPDGSGEDDTADLVDVETIPANNRSRLYRNAAMIYAFGAIDNALQAMGEDEAMKEATDAEQYWRGQ